MRTTKPQPPTETATARSTRVGALQDLARRSGIPLSEVLALADTNQLAAVVHRVELREGGRLDGAPRGRVERALARRRITDLKGRRWSAEARASHQCPCCGASDWESNRAEYGHCLCCLYPDGVGDEPPT